jgi:thymidylate synthase
MISREKRRKEAQVTELCQTIPVLRVCGQGLPEAWERSITTLLYLGAEAPTQYDRPGDPPSLDSMMVMEVQQPLLEPRIHGYFPGGPRELEEYCMEVMEGIKDHWTRNPLNPEDKRWSYTYHGRLCRAFGVDQIAAMTAKLIKQPFTRQAQFTTWMPASDPQDFDPPCLQRGWARILREKQGILSFHAHLYFRSRDALKAAFMNSFAFVRLFDELVRKPVEAALGETVNFARYVEVNDSYHIYGKDRADAEAAFTLDRLGKRYTYEGVMPPVDDCNDPWKPMMDEERPSILAAVAAQDAQRKERGD